MEATRRRKGFWRRKIVAAAVLVAAVTWGLWRFDIPLPASANVAAPAPHHAAKPKVPVDIATAGRADVPVYLDGLGSVQAYNTATVKSRVDGEIQKVAFVEGQAVHAGDVLVQIDPRPYQAQYEQAAAKKAQDEAQLGNARLDLGRYQRLLATAAASRQQADTQRATVAQLEATVRADQGAIDAAKVQLDYTTITAPFDGITGIRQVDPGNIVHATDTGGIVVVTQMQPISVVFTLPEDQLAPISGAMQEGPVEVSAMSTDGKTELDRGTVLLIDNEIDQATGTIRIKATFRNARRTLWPGQFVNVRLLLNTEHDVLTVPSAAVERGPDGLFAYVVGADDTVERRALTIGHDDGAVTVVDDGLQEGDRVVTAGQYRLEQGARVAATPAKPAARTAARKPRITVR